MSQGCQPDKHGMNILLHVFSNDESGYNADYDYAILRLSDELALDLAEEMKFVRELKSTRNTLVSLEFDEGGDFLSFYDNGTLTKNKDNLIDPANSMDLEGILTPEEFAHWETHQWCILRDDFKLPLQEEELGYYECFRVHYGTGYYWRIGVKNAPSLTLETVSLHQEILSRVI